MGRTCRSVDATLVDSIVAAACRTCRRTLPVLFLPTQAVG
jgi:hypothetical protein